MWHDDIPRRCEAAYRRKFSAGLHLKIERTGENEARISDPERGGWCDFDVSAWRIRAIRWNAPTDVP